MKSIKILGAGISGLTAAINLAKAGFKVDVYERNKDVGMRFGGDLQGLENWSDKEDVLDMLKQMNININFDCDPFSKIFISDGLKENEINFNKNAFYLVKRGNFLGTLDYGLKKQAVEGGVNIFFEKTMLKDNADIVATGPIMDETCAIAKGIIFRTKTEDMVIGLLNNEAGYKGYSYLLITKGYGCMCSVVFGELGRINECFEKTMERFNKINKIDIENPKNVGGIGCFSIKNVFKSNNNLLVGEAAGLQDMFWGFGMKYAFTSGYLAAQSIINNEDYEKKTKERFSNKLRSSLVNRFLWEKINFGNYSFLIDKVKSNPDLLGSLYSFHNYNYFQKIIYPFALYYMRKKYPNLKL